MANQVAVGDARGGNPFIEPQAGFQDRFRRAMECVCRIDINGNPAGTGFLVGPYAVLTNFHVVEPALRDGVLQGLSCLFDFVADPTGGMRTGARVDVARLAAHSRYGMSEDRGSLLALKPGTVELDFALLRLTTDHGRTAAPAAARPRGWLPLPADLPRIAQGGALYVVQHPAGGPAAVAGNDRGISGFAAGRDDRLVYRVSTSPGSSGSGCFNERWELVALHNFGDPAWSNPNAAFGRGIPIHLVRAEILRQASGDDIPAIVEAAEVDSVAAALRMLMAAVRDDDRLTGRIGTSHDLLEEIATRLRYLVAYKALHDFLHELQKKTIQVLRLSLTSTGSDAIVHAVAEHLMIDIDRIREEAEHTRPSGRESRNHQFDWIDEMRTVASRLRDDATDAAAKRDLVERARRTARRRLARLNTALVDEAYNIDLMELGRVLRDALEFARPGGGSAESDAAGSLERLSLELHHLVTEHQLWQDLENDLQGLEDRVRDDRSVIDREGFQNHWRESLRQVNDMCSRDMAATWATSLLALAREVEALVADLAWDRVGFAFGEFRRSAFERFYRVDKALLAHCHEIGRLGEPLRSLLRLV